MSSTARSSPPKDVMCRRDGDDPYLVVAADKGTATFSDIANGISQLTMVFWLDDAFASGGSAGYDHKKMGITARGAWEAVKRHFPRDGRQHAERSRLRSPALVTWAATSSATACCCRARSNWSPPSITVTSFIDPDPSPAVSYQGTPAPVRKPRSGWDDYDDGRISKGGGVYSRQAKTIRLSNEARKLLDLDKPRHR